jgi:Uma2 family endonuclease
MLTERDPDTVRGPDVSYYSYQRVPKGPLPDGLLAVAPELVFEVRSPTDRWSDLHTKAAEYLSIDVLAVCVLDDTTRSAHLFYGDRPSEVLKTDDDFSLPEILGDFRVRVDRFFQ